LSSSSYAQYFVQLISQYWGNYYYCNYYSKLSK